MNMGCSLMVGGNYNNAAQAGLFILNCNNNPSNNNSNIGGRLAKGITPEALQPLEVGTECAFWRDQSSLASSARETTKESGRLVTIVKVVPTHT